MDEKEFDEKLHALRNPYSTLSVMSMSMDKNSGMQGNYN